MTTPKKSTKAKLTGIAAAKPATQKAVFVRARKAINYRHASRSVAFATVGGFKVFGSPVQPAHRTASQIEAAVDGLN